MTPLANHRILITGAARGLGEAFARAALTAGARVALTDVLNERGSALALELNAQFDGRAKYVHMDVSHSASVNAAMADAIDWLGGLDGLINNAAITDSGGRAMDTISEEIWDKVMAVNVRTRSVRTRRFMCLVTLSLATRLRLRCATQIRYNSGSISVEFEPRKHEQRATGRTLS